MFQFRNQLVIVMVFLVSLLVVTAENCVDPDNDIGLPDFYLKKGACTDDTQTLEDVCDESGLLKEAMCQPIDNSCAYPSMTNCQGMMEAEGRGSNYICQDGRCVQTSDPIGFDLTFENFEYNEGLYKDKKHVTIFIDIVNLGTMKSKRYDIIYTINGVQTKDLLNPVNPKDRVQESMPFEAIEGENTIHLDLIDPDPLDPVLVTTRDLDNSNNKFSKTINIVGVLKDSCTTDSACNDNDISTKDICSGTPKVCSNTKITECTAGDSYCPLNCKSEQDTDCKQQDECSSETDCDDTDVSTKDQCSGTPKKCSNTKIKECIGGDNYCPSGCDFSLDNDCEEKELLETSKDKDLETLNLQDSENALTERSKDESEDLEAPKIKEKTDFIEDEISSDSEKSSNMAIYLILGGLVVLLIIIVLGIQLFKGKSSATEDPLKDYVKTSLSKGYTPEQIKQSLIQQGFSEEDINKYFL